MTALALLKRYWQFAVIAALVAYAAVLKVTVAEVRVDLAAVTALRAQDNEMAATVARNYTNQLREKEQQHARDQQDQDNHYAAAREAWVARVAADAALAGSLRDKLAAYTKGGGRRAGDSDAVAYQRAADRLQIVAGLLAEGQGLVVEGIGVVERRDLEVMRLIDQIAVDRRACSGAAP